MIRALILAVFLTASASAQIAIPAAPREFVVDAVVEAARTEVDTVLLHILPARSAVTAVYIASEGDTLWARSGSAQVRYESPASTPLVTWSVDDAALLDCYGCASADWAPGAGTIAYCPAETRIVLDMLTPSADLRGRLRIIIRYIILV
jgi:hypothetical protein